MSVTQKKINLN